MGFSTIRILAVLEFRLRLSCVIHAFYCLKDTVLSLAQSPMYRVLCGMIAREPSDGCLYVARSGVLLR